MPIYPFRCPKCNAEFELHTSVNEYDYLKDKVRCPGCAAVMARIYEPINVICRWGTGFVAGERVGYIPGVDDPETEIKADMKALEEKQMHEDNPAKRKDLRLALSRFAEAHEDILT